LSSSSVAQSRGWPKVRPTVKLQVASHNAGAQKTGGIREARNNEASRKHVRDFD